MDITLLINPTAGRGRGARAAAPAIQVLRSAGFTVRPVIGSDAADALFRARAAVRDGTDAVVAVGGDGMVGIALQVTAETDIPLGVIAVGTGNDFARAVGLPVGDTESGAHLAAAALKEGTTRAVDLGRVSYVASDQPAASGAVHRKAEDRPRTGRTRTTPTTQRGAVPGGTSQRQLWGSVAGTAGHMKHALGHAGGRWFGTVLASGFDSRVNDRVNRMRWPPGRLRYDLALLAELGALRPVRFRLGLDGAPGEYVEATLVAVGNGASYGGGLRICGGARLDDGVFDVTVVAPCSRGTLLRVFPRVYRGTHLFHPLVTVYRASSVYLDADQVTAYADGEPLGALPLTATTISQAVQVLVPKKIECRPPGAR